LEQFFNKSFSVVCDIEIIEFEKGFEMDVTVFCYCRFACYIWSETFLPQLNEVRRF